jgi:4-hydroxy-2-oxoheptanedioate aldolase
LKGEAVRELMDSGEHISQATQAYLEERNKNSVAIIGIESVAAVKNLEKILEVPGIDGIFVGPNDLSISLGIPDQYDRPEYKEAVKRIIDTCEARGVAVLVHHQSPELSTYWMSQGARFILHGTDRRALAEGFRGDFSRLRDFAKTIQKPARRPSRRRS